MVRLSDWLLWGLAGGEDLAQCFVSHRNCDCNPATVLFYLSCYLSLLPLFMLHAMLLQGVP